VGNLSYIGRDLDLGELGGQLTFFPPAIGELIYFARAKSNLKFEIFPET
jgi:hypothetical protein